MKKMKWLLLLLLLLPLQVFAAPSVEEAEGMLQKFGLTPTSTLNRPYNYIAVYGSGYTENYKMINVSANITAPDPSGPDFVLCDEAYSDKPIISVDNGLQAYKVNSIGICYKGDDTRIISYDFFNSVYKSLYGNDAPKKDIIGFFPHYIFYEYNTARNSYIQLTPYGVGGTTDIAGSVYKTISVKENNNDLSIIVAYENIRQDEQKLKIGGKEYDGQKNIDEIVSEIKNNYINDIDHYTITLSKKDNNYVFKSLTKIETVEVPNTAAFTSYGLYLIGAIVIAFGAFLFGFARKSRRLIKED